MQSDPLRLIPFIRQSTLQYRKRLKETMERERMQWLAREAWLQSKIDELDAEIAKTQIQEPR